MATKRAAPRATELAFDRYEHRAELGHGGSGRVVEVLDRADDGALRAIKIVLPEHAERLGWELEVLAGLAHPSLARVHELLRVERPLGPPFRLPRGAFVLVEDRAPGAPSDTVFVALDAPARAVLARAVAAQVAGALAALHARGLAHGDVKPGNVVVRAEGEPHATLVDLGLAVAFGRSGIGGTPRFLAPEALLGERSPATDLYALGGTLHEWLVGAGGDATRSDLPAHGPSAWSELPSWVDPELAALVRSCLSERPADRPRLAADVARALGARDVLTLLGAPSAVERARRASVVPMVGRTREVERIASAIRAALAGPRPRPALIAVRGPAGSGRTRVVMEAVRAAQSEIARAAQDARVEVPTFRPFRRSPVVPHTPTILFAQGDGAEAVALHRAAVLSGAPVVVVLEREAEVSGADVDVVLEALGAVPFGELTRLLLEGSEGSVAEAYRRAARGLPGVLVRMISERWMSGGDPRAGPVEGPSRALVGADLGAGRDLALAAALAGGAIDSRTARRVAGRDASRIAETLVARGIAGRDPDGRLRLTDAYAARVLEDATPEARRAAAALVASTLGPGPGRALARGALGAPDAADELLAEATALRDAGSPEGAAQLLARARVVLADDRLLVAHADALLAAGDVVGALALLEGTGDTWLRGEALRRAGRWDEARALLERLDAADRDRPAARASLVRIALALGKPPPELEGLRGSGRASAFVQEALALAAAARGQPERALAIAEAERDAVEAAAALPAFERARAGARLCAVEASARAALGDAEGAHAAFERSARLAAAAGERHAAAAFLVNLGIGRLELGLLGPAIEALTRGAEQLVLLGRDRDAARALYNVANAALLAGDRAHARHAAEGARDEATRVGDEDARALAEVILADVDVGEGRPRAAQRRLTELAERGPSPLVASRLATARALGADLAGARAALARATLDDDAPTPIRIEHALAQARLSLAAGDPHAASEIAREALARLGARGGFELRLRALSVAVDVADALGDGPSVQSALRSQRSLLDRALASLPPERHAQFRALHARALGAEPAQTSGPGTEAALVAGHARALLEEASSSAIAARLVASARTLAAAEHAFLVVREPSGALAVRAGHGAGGALDVRSARFSTSIVARCLDRRARVVSIDAGADLALDPGASIHALAVRSVVAVPLAQGERPAVLYVDDRLRPSAFGASLVEALEDLSAFASIAFANAARARRERRAQALAARRERTLRVTLEEKTREAALLAAERPDQVDLVAESPAMRAVVALAARVAASDASVLLTGESGTGKEVVARFVHRASARAGGPFVAESCAAIPAALFESALFGHARGAFSGAVARRRGLFELAEGGTLFLDEIGELPLPMQAKLLRALSAREIRPMGAERTRPIDVRVVAASHRDLRAMVQRGELREDLFYRLAVVEIALPPLRERPEDVEPLVRHFAHAQGAATIEPSAIAALSAHPWPGNVRELENEVRRALALDGGALLLANLSTRVRGDTEAGAGEGDLDVKRATDRLERRLVERALTRAGHNVTQAARLLGLSRFGLQKMMSRHASTRR